MAIRSGTGGLKYPLPSLAQIRAQQSAASASAGGSASASAYGTNRQFTANKMRIQADLANSAADREFRARSQMQEQGFRAQQQFYDREHQAGAQLEAQRAAEERQAAQFAHQDELQLGAQGFSAAEADLDREFTMQRDKARYEAEQAAIAKQQQDQDTSIQAGINAGTLEYAPGVQKRLDAIAAGRIEAQKGDAAQQADYEKQAAAEEAALRRMVRPTQDPNAGIRHYDPQRKQYVPEPGEGTIAGTVGRDGQFQPITTGPDTSKDDAKRQADLQKRAEGYTSEINPETVTKDNPGKPYTREEAIAKAIADQEAYDKAFGPQPAPAPGTGQQPGQPASPQVTKGAAAGGMGAAGGAGGTTAGIPKARPQAEVQSVVNDVRSSMKDVPIEEGKETPELRGFLDKNMEDIVRYHDVPPEQVPEKSRAAVDFYGRYMRSAVSGQPIVVRTPEEAAMLPPDTPFVDADGKPRRTKKKAG